MAEFDTATVHESSLIVVVPLTILLAIALIIYVARIYFRAHPTWQLRWDDYTITFGQVLTTVWYSLTMYKYWYDHSHESRQPSMEDRRFNMMLVNISGLIYLWALNIIRISMCLMLLRLKDSPIWKRLMWSLLSLQIALIIVATAVQLSFCTPVAAVFGEVVPDMKCLPASGMKIYAYTWNIVNIICDFILSLLPISFIWRMHKSRSEKFVIGCLMAAGLFATTSSIIKLVKTMSIIDHLSVLNPKVDVLYGLEIFLGVIAASLPCLKAPAHRLLVSWGVISKRDPAAASPSSFLNVMSHGSHFFHQLEVYRLRSGENSEA